MEAVSCQEKLKFPRLDGNSCPSAKIKNFFDLLPYEILLKIFLYVKDDDIFSFYNTMTKVCTTWKKIAMDYKLWQVVCVPPCAKKRKSQFMKWKESDLLSKAKELNLVNLGAFLTTEELKAICSSCPQLRCLAIGNQKLPKRDFFQSLFEDCPNLSHLNISCVESFSQSSFGDFFQKRGENIEQLGISQAYFVGRSFMSSLALYCPNIQELDMSNLSGPEVVLPVAELQEKCPAIRILRLTNTSFSERRKKIELPGFLNLEEISLAVIPGNDSVSDGCFWRILSKSAKLKVLDIRGCTKLTSKTIMLLPANNLEFIFMSHTKPHLMGSPELIMAKYKHSLTEIDLSWNSCANTLTSMIEHLICAESSPLETLDLSGTRITLPVVRIILDNFKHLNVLKLHGCRSIERNWRYLCYKNKLQEFRQEIEKHSVIDLV